MVVMAEIGAIGNPGIAEVGEHLTDLQCFCIEVFVIHYQLISSTV